METEKISVIVPVYNVEPFLCQCLDSITRQTYQNLEIICIDDGSTDGCLAILRKYEGMDSRIIVIHQEHDGTAKARNKGLDNATGEWITFVDSDDWLEPEMYKKMMTQYSNAPADIIACGYAISTVEGNRPVVNRRPVPEGTQDIRSFLYYVYYRDEYPGVTSYITNKVFRASLVNTKGEGLRFDLSLKDMGEDIEWASRCFIRAKTITFLPDSLYHYRVREDSTFHNMEKRLESLGPIFAYEKMINLYEKHNLNPEILDYVKRFYVYHLGVLMDYAKQHGFHEKQIILRNKALPYIPIYIKTNQNNPERIAWITQLFGEK